MRRVIATLLALALLASPVARATPSVDGVWLVPNPGSLDLLQMFERPDDWARARALTQVFQFTQQHLQVVPDPIVGPNSYDALVRAGAFRQLKQWGKHVAIGVGAVKEFYCTPDATGMAKAADDAERAIRAVMAAGGDVSYLAMDEPFLSGHSPVCGGPDLSATADRLGDFMSTLRRDFPAVQIGLIEAYPSFLPADFQQMLRLMAARGVAPAFVQLDVDIRAVRPPRDLTADLRAIRQAVSEARVPFGLIVWGYNGDANALFAQDATRLANAFAVAFPTWKEMPEQISIQSWSPSSTGLLITPSNLPESQPYTLTNILLGLYRRFRGGDPSAAIDVAVPRG